MKNNWKMEFFSATKVKENLDRDIFTVPRYQRGIVWNDQQRLDLVDTIKKGLPFGSLLLYKDNNSTYQIIDGLQRSKAIFEFVNNPTQFFDEEDIDSGVITNIVKMADVNGSIQSQEKLVRDMLISWVKSHTTLAEVESMQFSKFGKLISDSFPTCKGKEFEIGDFIEPMMKNYQDICKTISDTEIPAIVYSGELDLLPTLFERINSKGTQLSKYQIYAATWSGKKYKLNDKYKDLVKANRDRYDQMLEGTATLDDYDSLAFLNAKELDAFEIAFGFGKYLSDKWPHLFGKSLKETTVESIGFTLITACLGIKNNKASTMNLKLENQIGQANINNFLDKIVDAVEITDKCIGKYSKFKSNSRVSSGERPLHTEMQVASIIVSVFLMKTAIITLDKNEIVEDISYNFDQNNQEWNSNDKKRFKENVSKIYLMETFQKRWVGTGDKKLDNMLINPKYYTREVTQTEFISVLDLWFDSMNTERSEYKRVATPKEQELMFLSAVYQSAFSAAQQVDGSNYDIEHLATQNLMKKHLERINVNGEKLRLPISSIGNLCLLPEYANRSKKDKTLYDDDMYLKKSGLNLKEIEDKYSFTEKKDLEWINDNSIQEIELERKYMEFVRGHFQKMKDILIDNYDKL